MVSSATEADVERACRELVDTLQGKWENYSQVRRSKVAVIPDARVVFPQWQARVWVELKRPSNTHAKGKMTRAQHAWLLSELDAGGLATVIDDVQQLATIIEAMRKRSSIQTAMIRDLCYSLVEFCAKRGYRGERKDGTPFRKRRRRAGLAG